MTTTLGERLALIRGKARQEDFAEQLGVSRQTLIRYEKDERIPGADFLKTVILETGVDSTWLLLGVGEPPKPEINVRESILLDHFRPVSYTHLTLPTKRIV